MAGGDGCADLFLFCERFHVEAILLEQLFERYVVPSLWLVRSTLSLEKAKRSTASTVRIVCRLLFGLLLAESDLTTVFPILLLEALGQKLVPRLRNHRHGFVHEPS